MNSPSNECAVSSGDVFEASPSFETAASGSATEIVSSSASEVVVFNLGARVSTAYGRGVVTSIRTSPDVYEVKLDFGTGFLAASSVKIRRLDDLSFDEIIDDTETLRARGNAAFAAKDYDAALQNYKMIADTLSLSASYITLPQRHAMREAIVKSLSNITQARICKGDIESAKIAVTSASDVRAEKRESVCIEHARACACCRRPYLFPLPLPLSPQALSIDPTNQTGQRDKLLFRRATALMMIKEFEMAIEDLKDPILATHAGAVAKLREAKEALKREEEKERSKWRKGFAKAAAEASKEEEGGGVGLSPPSSPRKVHFSAVDAAAAAATAAAAAGASGESSAAATARVSTPHPAKGGGGKGFQPKVKAAEKETADDKEDEEDEAYEEDSVLTYAAFGAVVVATGLAAFLGLRFLWARK